MIKWFSFIFLIIFSINFSMAYELDVSVDDEIRKKYITKEIEIPKNENKIDNNINNNINNNDINKSSVLKNNFDYSKSGAPTQQPLQNKTGIKLPAGVHFKIKNDTAINDTYKLGKIVAFSSIEPVIRKNITIPVGTKFKGIVIKSHSPQIAGNGGLVVLKITEMTYSGKTYSINAKITKVKDSKIIFNNIKGKRQYLAEIKSQIQKGKNFYNKTKQTSNNLANNPVGKFISPIPPIFGAIGSGVVALTSPAFAVSQKGKNVSIPAGTVIEVKLLDKVYI